MKFGLEDRHWEFVYQTLIAPLKKHGCSVWIFGSRATGKQKKFSDLDVLYAEKAEPLPPTFLATVMEALEESSLPIKVDIVNEANLAESYRPSVMAEKVSV